MGARSVDGATSARRVVPNIALLRGDTLTLRGRPDGGEPAPFDYIEVIRAEDNANHRTP